MMGLTRFFKVGVMGVLGTLFTGVYASCYGVYVELVKGRISDLETGTGIPDILVSCDLEGMSGSSYDDGSYEVFDFLDTMPPEGTLVRCRYEDVDGRQNGLYASHEEIVSYDPAGATEIDVELVSAE